jgi:hypothetical protein
MIIALEGFGRRALRQHGICPGARACAAMYGNMSACMNALPNRVLLRTAHCLAVHLEDVGVLDACIVALFDSVV